LPALLLSACIVTADQSVESNPKDPRAQDIVDKIKSIDPVAASDHGQRDRSIKQQSSSRPAIYLSDGNDTAERAAGRTRRQWNRAAMI